MRSKVFVSQTLVTFGPPSQVQVSACSQEDDFTDDSLKHQDRVKLLL